MYRMRLGIDAFRKYKTLFGLLQAARDQMLEEVKHGLFRDLEVEIQLTSDSPWKPIDQATLDRAAVDMNLARWREGRPDADLTEPFCACGRRVSMCDGSVRFVSETIDLPTWRALGSRAGHEAVETGLDL